MAEYDTSNVGVAGSNPVTYFHAPLGVLHSWVAGDPSTNVCVAQSVERDTPNVEAAGSNPAMHFNHQHNQGYWLNGRAPGSRPGGCRFESDVVHFIFTSFMCV